MMTWINKINVKDTNVPPRPPSPTPNVKQISFLFYLNTQMTPKHGKNKEPYVEELQARSTTKFQCPLCLIRVHVQGRIKFQVKGNPF